MAFNAIKTSGLSLPSVFRIVQNARATIAMDEEDVIASEEKGSAFRRLLYEGYKAGGVVVRTEKVGRNQVPVPITFMVYSPKAMANIAGIEEILADRTIEIIMIRSTNPEIIDKPDPDASEPQWRVIRNMLYPLALRYWREIKSVNDSDVDLPSIHGRALELWRPLVVLAKFFDRYVNVKYANIHQTTLEEAIIALAIRKEAERKEEEVTESKGLIMLRALVKLVMEDGWYKVSDIRKLMEKMYDEPQKWLNPHWIGHALKRFGFTRSREGEKRKRRLATGYEYLLEKSIVHSRARKYGLNVDEILKEAEEEEAESEQERLV